MTTKLLAPVVCASCQEWLMLEYNPAKVPEYDVLLCC